MPEAAPVMTTVRPLIVRWDFLMPRLLLAPVLARSSLRSSIVVVFGISCVLLEFGVGDGSPREPRIYGSGVVGDQVDDPAPRADGQIVAEAGDGFQAAPGIARAVAAPPVGCTIRSRSPWMTNVGTSMWPSSAVRSPDAKMPRAAGRCPRGWGHGPTRCLRTRGPRTRRTGSRGNRCGGTCSRRDPRPRPASVAGAMSTFAARSTSPGGPAAARLWST